MSLYERSMKLILGAAKEEVKATAVPILTELMKHCHNNNKACLYSVFGPRGAGKSTYALLAANAFLTKDYTRKCLVDIRDIIFTADEFVFEVQKIYNNVMAVCEGDEADEVRCIAQARKPFLIIDDAGVGFSKYIPRFSPQLAHAVKGVLDLIRMMVSNVILTSPMHVGLLKAIREDIDTYVIVIDYLNSRYSVAKIYSVPSIVPWGGDWRIYRKKIGIEVFERHTCCYDSYMAKKKEMTQLAINQLKDTIRELHAKKGKHLKDIMEHDNMEIVRYNYGHEADEDELQ